MIRNDIAIILPVYNNVRTVGSVIEHCKTKTENLIVIDDGCDDGSEEIIKEKAIIYQRHDQNQGKGKALKTGFQLALEKGLKYAVTIDADGQHNPDEIEIFEKTLEKHPDALIIGVRNFDENVPKGSVIGRRISNFWMTICTHKRFYDAQSGFRLYPIHLLKNLKLKANRYDFELEIMIKSVWEGISIVHIPVDVVYQTGSERVSHFDLFKDNVRISKTFFKHFFLALIKMPILYLKKIIKLLRR